MLTTMDLPTYQLVAGSGGKRERKGLLNDTTTTLPNTTPPGRRDGHVQTRDMKVRRPRGRSLSPNLNLL